MQVAFGAGSSVTNQFGYVVDASLTGATNNYGFYGNIAAGTGRYNLHMGGSADNYLAGRLGIGINSPLSNCHIFTTGGQTTTAITTNTNVESFFIAMHNSAAVGAGGGIIFGAQAGSFAAIKGALTNGSGNTAGDLCFSSRAATSDSALTERMRIDSSGNVGIGTTSPNASAILDVQSTTKGVRMPNMTTTQKNAIASPAAGLMVFDTNLAKLCVYSGAAWQTITSV